MHEKQFALIFNKFSKILQFNSASLQDFIFHSKIYVEGIRKSVIEVKKYCKKNSKVLDFGCGTGFISMLLANSGPFKVEGIDVKLNNPEMIEKLSKRKGLQAKIWKNIENENKNINFHFYNGIKVPFKDKTFDAVFAHATIEHVPTERLCFMFREIQRTLKPGGYFFIFRTPRKQSYAEYVARILQMGSHNVLMDENSLISMVEENGFKILSFKRTDLVFGVLPGKLQTIWNFLFPILLIIDKSLLKTPLNNFAHNVSIICQRNL